MSESIMNVGVYATTWRTVDGILHRTDGPAVIWVNGVKDWYLHGRFHRTAGPARESPFGLDEWWINGEQLTEEEFNERTKQAQAPGYDVRAHNVGSSDYAKHKIQPWDIWLEYRLNPWEADIVKRILRKKEGQSRREDLEKVAHICQELIRQIDAGEYRQ